MCLDFLDEPYYVTSSAEIILKCDQNEQLRGHTLALAHTFFRADREIKVNLSRLRLMEIPKHIGLYDIKSSFFGFTYQRWPHLQVYKAHVFVDELCYSKGQYMIWLFSNKIPKKR